MSVRINFQCLDLSTYAALSFLTSSVLAGWELHSLPLSKAVTGDRDFGTVLHCLTFLTMD